MECISVITVEPQSYSTVTEAAPQLRSKRQRNLIFLDSCLRSWSGVPKRTVCKQVFIPTPGSPFIGFGRAVDLVTTFD